MLTFLVAALIAISGLGTEATHPAVLFTYRSLLFVIVLWCAWNLYRTRSFTVCPIFLAACGVCSLLMLSFLRLPASFEGFYYWYPVLLFGALFVFLSAYARSQTARWKYRLLGLIVAIQLVYLFAGLVSRNGRITAGFSNPDYLASFLLVGFSVCVSVALFRSERLWRICGIAGAATFYYGITQTTSRGATVAAFVIVAAALFRYKEGGWLYKAGALAAVGALFGAGALVSPTLLHKFTDVSGSSNPYNYMRPKIWSSTLRMIRDYPVFGVGLGQYVYVSRRYAPALESGSVARYEQRPGIAHSEYLQYAAETGLPATLLLAGLMAYLMFLAIRRSRACSAESRAIQEAAILSAAGLASHAVVDNNWIVPVMAAGIVVFALADVLPHRETPLEFKWTSATKVAAAVILVTIYFHSTVIPALGLWFNQQAYRAFAVNDLNKAESEYETAADILPLHSPFLDERGKLCLARYEQTQDPRWLRTAEDFFAQASDANPDFVDPLRHLERALILSLTGDAGRDARIHPEIATVDRSILRVDPFDPFIRKNLAEALYRDGRRKEAEEELERAVQIEPNYVPAWLTLAKWENEAGDFQNADQFTRKATDILMKYRDLKTAEPYELLLLGR